MPLVIVTVVPVIEQAPVAAIVAAMPEVGVVAIVKVDPYTAEVGAPVKVTVGATLADTVVASVTVAAAR